MLPRSGNMRVRLTQILELLLQIQGEIMRHYGRIAIVAISFIFLVGWPRKFLSAFKTLQLIFICQVNLRNKTSIENDGENWRQEWQNLPFWIRV